MTKKFSMLSALVLLSFMAFGQRSITISATPSDAKIYDYNGSRVGSLLGVGSARLKLSKKNLNRVAVVRDGFVTEVRSYPKTKKHPKTVHVALTTRRVSVSVTPFDAKIFANGMLLGSQSANVDIPKDASITLEVKKPGFATLSRTYHNRQGSDEPPLTEQLSLKDRLVNVMGPTGSVFAIGGVVIGQTNAEVIVSEGECVTLEVQREGYSPQERTYCHKPGLPSAPVSERFELVDRVVEINATPTEAEILIEGRSAGYGSFQVTIPEGQSVEVAVRYEGYVPIKRTYHNRRNYQSPPTADHLELVIDEAFVASTSSDQANVNFTIPVGQHKSEDEAWRTISQIVMNKFDLIELSDKSTGYLRTAYQVKRFAHNTIRTRVIVKMGNFNPLRYVMKIVSESSNAAGTSIKDDEDFKEWDRILNSYKDLIDEAQARLR